VAIAAPIGEPPPGIDVVEITDRDEATLRYALTGAELGLLDRLGGDRMLWFARFWAAKEAVGKAIGTGLAGAPRRFVVRDRDLGVAVDGRLHQVSHTEVASPPGSPSRRYVVAWTRGHTQPSES
jgi:phosphopantetheinyl transferase